MVKMTATRVSPPPPLLLAACAFVFVCCLLGGGAEAQPAGSRLPPAASDAYTVVDRLDEGDSVVAVVRRNGVLFLLYDETIIGAEFDDPKLRLQTAFPGFTIMQCSAYLARKPTRAMQIGLGIGSVPSFLRNMGIPTDVVEISDAVVQQAANYFQYDWCSESDEDEEELEEPVQCPNGHTFVTDGLKFLAQTPVEAGVEPGKDGMQPYDLVIVDVYTGWNPFAFFLRERVAELRTNWLQRDGVLVMNFVGFMHGPRAAAPKSIYRTLQSLFRHVKCFREMADASEPDAANIVFYASDEPFSFKLPTTREYRNAPENTYFAVVANFPTWEIFTELQEPVEVAIHQELEDEELRFVTSDNAAADDNVDVEAEPRVRVLTQADHGQEAFREIHTETQSHMRARVLDQFPPALWAEFQQKPSATPTP